MLIFVKETRHTAAGTFRAGVVYEIAPGDDKARKAVNPHLGEDGPMVEVTKAQVKKVGAAIVMLAAPAGVGGKVAEAKSVVTAESAVATGENSAATAEGATATAATSAEGATATAATSAEGATATAATSAEGAASGDAENKAGK